MTSADSQYLPAPSLSDSMSRVYGENRHAAQLVSPGLRQFADYAIHGLAAAPLTTADSPSRMKYRRRGLDERSTNHWGQLKLHIMEVRFLTQYACGPGRCDKEWVVVYAGAAPGQHIAHLASLFPNCTFDLYDPAEFCQGLKDCPPERVKVFRQFFTEKTAAQYRGRDDVLFISDIRTCQTPAPVDAEGEEDGEAAENAQVAADVHADMQRQAGWCNQILPAAVMLKFRLPWAKGKTSYFGGEVWIQPWAPTASTETRLVATRAQLCATPADHDHTEHEEKMMYHNTVGRCRLYDHGLRGGSVKGLCHCYDCAVTVRALRGYLEATRRPAGPEEVAAHLAETLSEISGSGRTLAHSYSKSSTLTAARGGFRRRDYTDDKLTYLDAPRTGPARKSEKPHKRVPHSKPPPCPAGQQRGHPEGQDPQSPKRGRGRGQKGAPARGGGRGQKQGQKKAPGQRNGQPQKEGQGQKESYAPHPKSGGRKKGQRRGKVPSPSGQEKPGGAL